LHPAPPQQARRQRCLRASLALLTLSVAALPAHASLFTGDALDAVANGIAWVVICVVPIIAIVVFWIVHVMPEKIAHKRHHPQVDAIHTLCLLSLVFGGLLWPIAWLWAYTKPTAYRSAYGTDKHESYHLEMADKARAGTLSAAELAHLRDELDAMQRRGALPPALSGLREELDSMSPAAAHSLAGSA
jgi:CBS domain containing-hemolysin-like protein